MLRRIARREVNGWLAPATGSGARQQHAAGGGRPPPARPTAGCRPPRCTRSLPAGRSWESAGVSGAEAAEQVRRDEALVTERVAAARTRGRSWNRIAVAFGVSSEGPYDDTWRIPHTLRQNVGDGNFHYLAGLRS